MATNLTYKDKKGRVFRMRSQLEIKLAQRMDRRHDLSWDYESLHIKVKPEQQAKVGSRYLVPDFQLRFPCGERWIIEGKGITYFEDYIKKKEKVVIDYCKENGINYQIVLSDPTGDTADEWNLLVNIKGYHSIQDWSPRTLQEWEDYYNALDAKELGEEIMQAVHGFDW